MYNIVTINVSQTIGATPSNLQQMSAILSFGSTLQPAGTPVLLTQPSDITDLVSNAIDTLEAEATSSGSDFTMTLPAGTSITRSQAGAFEITLKNCIPSAWNGTYQATLQDSSTLVWSVPSSTLNGSPTSVGQFMIEGSSDLVTAAETFFAQGSRVGTYVLELGDRGGVVAKEVDTLKTYINDPFKQFYAYLVPAAWGGNTDFITLAKLYTSNESKLYFFVLENTPTDTNYLTPYSAIKSIIAIADDTYPVTNAAAAFMWNFVSASPSEINKVPPMAFRYLLAVNANQAKQSILTTMVSQNINYVDTGAEGGISNTILVKGVSSDGKDLSYWYSVDWVQINMDLAIANAIINGSNNLINPLYYNQPGIDRLQLVGQGVMNTAVAYGLANGQPEVDAVSFKSYTSTNPNDYGIGRYAGLSVSYTPMRGFTEIIFNINVTMQLS